MIGNKILIMDGAHNAHKLSALAESIKNLYPNKSIATLISMAKTGDDRTVLFVDLLSKLASYIIVTNFEVSQDVSKVSVEPRVITKLLDNKEYKNYHVETDAHAALGQLLNRPEDILLVSGSFFLINNLRSVSVENND